MTGQEFYDEMQAAKRQGLTTMEFLTDKARADTRARILEVLSAVGIESQGPLPLMLDYARISDAAEKLANAAGAVVAFTTEPEG